MSASRRNTLLLPLLVSLGVALLGAVGCQGSRENGDPTSKAPERDVDDGQSIGQNSAGRQDGRGEGPDAVSKELEGRVQPRAVTDEVEHSFGVVDPNQSCEHVFFVRNEGDAPLKIWKAATSCSCFLSSVPKKPIPPGGSAAVKVAAKLRPGEWEEYFSHTASVGTNDPDRELIHFRINCQFLRHLAASPPEVLCLGRLKTDDRPVQLVVYSQVWEQFEISEVTSSLPGARWDIEPAGEAALEDLKARSGYAVSVHLPETLPPGIFRHVLRFTGAPPGSGVESRSVSFPMIGSTPKPVSVFGKHLLPNKVLQMGMVRADRGATEVLTMKVSDAHRRLSIRRITTSPDYLKVRVKPYEDDEKSQLGLYRIEVEIPRGSPEGGFLGDAKGEVNIETDHPESPNVTFKVAYAVIGG